MFVLFVLVATNECKSYYNDCDCKMHSGVTVCNSLVIVIVTFLLL